MSFDFSTHKAKRRLVQILSTVLTIVLPFLNILRMDVPTLRFYFFNTALWLDEFYLIFLVAMLILWVIVIFSMMYGRVWCGWMCPQTVLNELFSWFKRIVHRRLGVPRTGGSWQRRGAAMGIISLATAGICLIIGFNLVAYFVDPYRMLGEIAKLTLGPVTTGCILGIALLMFVDVMFWREKFCTKACPYAMLQVVITDAKTQIVRYQTERNDECIECKACVRDCMMGIDIRTSPYQTECIHCGDCVDSCTLILSRLKKPLPTLISFSWGGNEIAKRAWYEKLGFVDVKRWIVLGITAVYAIVLVTIVQMRQPLSITASGDRSTLYYFTPDSLIYNKYMVRVSNRSISDGWFRIECSSEPSQGEACSLELPQNPVFLRSREVKDLRMSIYAHGSHFHPGPNRIQLVSTNTADAGMHAQADVVFFMPEPAVSTTVPEPKMEKL